MHGEPSPTPAEQEIAADGEIMRMLLIDWNGPWTVEEIGRQMDSPVEAADVSPGSPERAWSIVSTGSSSRRGRRLARRL
jgi:hypothetical protein